MEILGRKTLGSASRSGTCNKNFIIRKQLILLASFRNDFLILNPCRAAARLLELRVPNPWRISRLSLLNVVCCQRSLIRAYHSSRGIVSNVVCLSVIVKPRYLSSVQWGLSCEEKNNEFFNMWHDDFKARNLFGRWIDVHNNRPWNTNRCCWRQMTHHKILLQQDNTAHTNTKISSAGAHSWGRVWRSSPQVWSIRHKFYCRLGCLQKSPRYRPNDVARRSKVYGIVFPCLSRDEHWSFSWEENVHCAEWELEVFRK
jgi:hypothetical protein